MKTAFTLLVLVLPVQPYAQHQPLPAPPVPSQPVAVDDSVQHLASESLPVGDLALGKDFPEDLDPAQTYSQDLYLQLSSRYLRPFGYQSRGLGGSESYVNGVRINPSGLPAGGKVSWGGLQYSLDIPNSSMGLTTAEGLPAGLRGKVVWRFDPAQRKKETRLRYGFSTDLPGHQLSLNHHSGLLKKGWAWSLAANRRWCPNGYRPGTFFQGYALYFGIRKKLGEKVVINWNTFAAPDRRGLHQAATREALSLSDDPNYNPAWGYQEGSIRNAVVAAGFLPESRLNLDWKIGAHSLLRLAAALRWGYRQRSGLDWYNTADPRPDYYKNLPSYFLRNHEPGQAAQLQQQWASDPNFRQIDWQQLYHLNRTNLTTTNGFTGRRSLYVLGADHRDIKRYDLALQFRTGRAALSWNTGVQFSYLVSRHYRKMLDLLGGDYFVNLNQFAEQQYPNQPDLHQNDLLRPNAIIKTGDRYGYHYQLRHLHTAAWTYLKYKKRRLQLSLSGGAEYTGYQRYGFYKHGIFPDDSYGSSKLLRFLSYRLLGALQYNPDRQQQLWLRAGIETLPPDWSDIFISPQTRNTGIKNPSPERQQMLAFGYVLQHHLLTFRLNGFTAQAQQASRILRFYHETFKTGVNYVMRGIDQQHLGMEAAAKIQLLQNLQFMAAGSWKQIYYTSRPAISIYRDNAAEVLMDNHIVYLKNYYAGAGPQTALTAGLQYQPAPRSTIHIQGNYTDRHFIEMNPSRLTEEAVEQIEVGSATWRAIRMQQRLPAAFTLDAHFRQSLSVNKNSPGRHATLTLLIGVKNILNNQHIIQSAYQQLRFDFAQRDPQAFPEKYRILPGRLWYINFGITL